MTPTSYSDICFANLSPEVTGVLPSIIFGDVLDDQPQRLACVKELIL